MSKRSPKQNLEKGTEQGIELGGAAAGAATGAAVGALIGAVGGSIPGAGTTAGAKLGARKGADMGGGIGKDAAKGIAKGAKTVAKGRELIKNPVDTILDRIVKFVVDFFIPIPILGEYIGDAVAKHKGQIAMVLLSIVLLVVTLARGGSQATATPYEGLPDELSGYIEEGFRNIGTPHLSPFGGTGIEKTRITAYFDDPAYYRRYGRWHKAIDIVPNNDYYASNEAYKIHGDIVFFANCSGEATGKVENTSDPANYVEIVCNDGVHILKYVHNKYNFIPLNETVEIVAGQPIAVMGNTGRSDGAHIHYAIIKSGERMDPLPYIYKQ